MDLLYFFCLVLVMSLCASVFCALWSPAGKGLNYFALTICICVLHY